MKCAHRFGVKRFGYSSRSPTFAMQIDSNLQRRLRVTRRLYTVNAHVEGFWQISKIPIDVLADVWPQSGYVSVPSMTSEIDVRTNVQLRFHNCPRMLTQLVR